MKPSFLLLLLLLIGAFAPAWGQPELQTQDQVLLQLMRQLRSPIADERAAAATALWEKYASEAGPAVLPLLKDPDAKVRAVAAQTIGRYYYRDGFPAVLPLLDDPVPEVRAAAARAVGQYRNQPAVKPLMKLTGDPVPEVRAAAIAGLGAFRDVQFIQLLLDSLRDPEPQIRMAAADALGEISQLQNWVKFNGGPDENDPKYLAAKKQARWDEVKQELTALIKDNDLRVRVTGVIALWKFTRFERDGKLDSTSYAILVEALKYPDADIRQQAALTLANQQVIRDNPQLLNLFLDLLPEEQSPLVLRTLLLTFVHKKITGAYERILPLMQSTDGLVRHAALFALTQQDRTRATDLCLTALADPEQSVQIAALQGLNDRFISASGGLATPDPRIYDAVLPFVNKPRTRAAALSTLGATGDPRAIPLLLDALKDPSIYVQQTAIQFFVKHPDPRAYDGLIPLLETKESFIRAQVVSALGAIGDARALDALLAMNERDLNVRKSILTAISHFDDERVAPVIFAAIHDPDPQIRSTALFILRSMNTPAVVDTLVTILLQDKDADTRLQTAETLEQKRDSRMVPALITALQDTDTRVRNKVIGLLSSSRDLSALQPLLAVAEKDTVAEVREGAAAAALRLDYGNPETVLSLLKSSDIQVRIQAVKVAANLPSDTRVTEALSAILFDNPVPQIRLAFLQSLINQFSNARLMDFVLQAAGGTDRTERLAAFRALGKANSSQALEALLAAAKDPDAHIRATVISALGNRNEPRAVDALATALQDDDANVQRFAVMALGSRGDPRALESLLTLFAKIDSQNAGERSWIIAALGNYNDSRVVTILLRAATEQLQREEVERLGYFDYLQSFSSQDKRLMAVMALKRIGVPAVDAVLSLLKDAQPLMRAAAVALLQQIGNARALPHVQACIGDPDTLVRRNALRALRGWGDPRSLAAVLPALQDTDPGVRAEAALTAGEIGDRDAVPALLPLLDDAEADVQFAAAWALGKLGDARALDPVLAHLKTVTDSGVRAQLAFALAQLDDPRVTETLLTLLKDPDEGVRVNVISGLGRLKEGRAVAPLLAIITAPPHAHAPRVVKDGTISGIRTMASDARRQSTLPSDKDTAFIALAEIGDERAIEPLATVCKNGDDSDKIQAVTALARWNDPRAAQAVVAYLAQRASSTQYATSSQEFYTVCLDNVRTAAVTPMLDLLRSDNPRVRTMAAMFFTSLAKPEQSPYNLSMPVPPPIMDQRAVEPLARLCADADRAVQRAAQNALIVLAPARALPSLVQALQTERDAIRRNTANTINHLQGVDVTVSVLPLLQSAQANTRVAALIALQWAKQAGVAASVAPLLNDPDADVRFAAACTLASLHDARAFAPLSAALTDTTSSHYNDWRAYIVFGTLGDPRILDLLRQTDATPTTRVPVLAQIDDPRAITAFIEQLHTQEGFNEVNFRLTNSLRGMTVDPEFAVALNARLHHPQVMALLLEILRGQVTLQAKKQQAMSFSGDSSLPYANQQRAAVILGRLGDKQAVEPLIAMLGQGNVEFRKSVVTALKAITGQDFGSEVGKWREWWAAQEK